MQQPSPKWNESRSQADIPNLSTYQSQAIVSRRRTQSRSKQQNFEHSGELDTANNVLTEKTLLEDNYEDEEEYRTQPAGYTDPTLIDSEQKPQDKLGKNKIGKSALSFRGAAAAA